MRRFSIHAQAARTSGAAGFPLSSTGRGIEGEGWCRSRFSPWHRLSTFSPLTPTLSPLRGEGEARNPLIFSLLFRDVDASRS